MWKYDSLNACDSMQSAAVSNSSLFTYRVRQKTGHRLMTTILSNLNRFAIFFTGRFLGKFAVKCVLKIPPHLVYVATLPCETLLSAKQAVNDKLQSSVAAYLHLHCIMMQQDRALVSRNLERQGWFIYSSTKQLPIHTKKITAS